MKKLILHVHICFNEFSSEKHLVSRFQKEIETQEKL